jgi:MoaA/NifB/PqqE/SkfB family radical SAM enzyme
MDPLFPVSVELSLTSRCDVFCPWCSDLVSRKLCPDGLDLRALGRLFGELAAGGTRGVTIEGGGEPTLSPLFNEAAGMAVSEGLSVGLITNGASLFAAGRTPEFFSAFEWVRFSLDASSGEMYLRLKGRDYFERVLGGLAALSGLARRPALGVGYVLTGDNDDPAGLMALAGRLASLGADYLHLRPVVDHPGMKSRLPAPDLSGAETASFSVNAAALWDNESYGNVCLPCLAHSLSSVITADGSVFLCGRLENDPASDSLGNITREGFGSIWGGAERLRRTRLAADGGRCLALCPQCRMTKYNRLFDRLGRVRTPHFI